MDSMGFYQEIDKIYSDTRQFFERNSNFVYAKPISQNGETGFSILYTPAKLEPDLLIVGQNPSIFEPSENGKSTIDKMMTSGSVPEVHSYTKHDHLFAKKLRKHFETEYELLEECVGMNMWFFQQTKIQTNNKQELENFKYFCQKKCISLITLIRPKVIMAVGMNVFDTLNNSKKHIKTEKQENGKMRLFDYGQLGQIPVVGCPHITGARGYETGEVDMGVKLCIQEIKSNLKAR